MRKFPEPTILMQFLIGIIGTSFIAIGLITVNYSSKELSMEDLQKVADEDIQMLVLENVDKKHHEPIIENH